jgi:ubiquinone/menaquinone biosynthesis C-methylase UbiE
MEANAYERSFLTGLQVDKYDALWSPGTRVAYLWHLVRPWLRETVARTVMTRSGSRLLDFACGTGRVMAEVVDLVSEAHGVDISPEMVARARERVPNAGVYQGDLVNQDPTARDYDIVTMFRFVLNASPDTRAAVLVAAREKLARRFGFLIVNNHGNAHSARHWHYLYKSVDWRYQSELTDTEMREMLTEAGFEVVDRFGAGIAPSGLYHGVLRRAAQSVDAICARSQRLSGLSEELIYVARPAHPA